MPEKINTSNTVTVCFNLSLEALNDLRTLIFESNDLTDYDKELYISTLNESERYAIIQSTKFALNRLVQEVSSAATDKDNLDVIDAIEDNVCRLKSVLRGK